MQNSGPRGNKLNSNISVNGKTDWHTSYVLVPAYKAANNVIIVYKEHCIETLIEELGINNTDSINSKNIPTGDSCEAILKSYNPFMTPVGSKKSEDDQNLQYPYTGLPRYINRHTSIDLWLALEGVRRKTFHASSPSW